MEVFLFLLTILFAVTSSKTQETPSTEEDWCPYFGEPMANVTVPLGREAVLTCIVKNLGQYKVGWIRAEDQTVLSLHTRVVTHNPRVAVSQDAERGVWRLHLRQLRHTDCGCYMCQINTSPMKKQVGCLDVQVPPDIVDKESSSDLQASEGDNVTLSCRARGQPRPRIVWKREDGKPLTAFSPKLGFTSGESWSGDTLNLVHVDYRQMGAYLCIATNDIPPAVSKRIVLDVNFAPVVESPQFSKVGAILGSTITLTCKFHAQPNANSSWHTEIGKVHEYGGEYLTSEKRNLYEVTLELTIRSVSTIDLGRYYCSVFNDKGFARATIYVYEVRPEPTTERATPRSRVTKSRSRSMKRTTTSTTTEIIDVLPTYIDGGSNEISELAVEAERRQGETSGCRGDGPGAVALVLGLLLAS